MEDAVVWVEPAVYLPHHTGVGIVVAADRTVDLADAIEQATLAVKYADRGVIGLGLANDETGHPPEPFAAAFALARESGLLCVPHAGELVGPDSVRGALDACSIDASELQPTGGKNCDGVARVYLRTVGKKLGRVASVFLRTVGKNFGRSPGIRR